MRKPPWALRLACASMHIHPCAFHPARFSPAALQIAVLKETEGKGPYCSLVMAVVVVKDVLLFAAFAVNIELFRAVGGQACLCCFTQRVDSVHWWAGDRPCAAAGSVLASTTVLVLGWWCVVMDVPEPVPAALMSTWLQVGKASDSGVLFWLLAGPVVSIALSGTAGLRCPPCCLCCQPPTPSCRPTSSLPPDLCCACLPACHLLCPNACRRSHRVLDLACTLLQC